MLSPRRSSTRELAPARSQWLVLARAIELCIRTGDVDEVPRALGGNRPVASQRRQRYSERSTRSPSRGILRGSAAPVVQLARLLGA